MFDVRPAVVYANDIQKAIWSEGANVFKAPNPQRGTAISYWLKTAPQADVRITISDIMGREIRVMDGTKTAGMNRVQWNLSPTLPGGGRRGGGGAEQAAAPATQAAAPGRGAQPPAGQPAGAQRGAQPQQPALQAQQGGGGGRGGGNIAVPAGTYLVKVMLGDKVLGQKTRGGRSRHHLHAMKPTSNA